MSQQHLQELQNTLSVVEITTEFSDFQALAGLNKVAKEFAEGRLTGEDFIQASEIWLNLLNIGTDDFIEAIEDNIEESEVMQLWLP